ncbi:MAG: hypothetical protein ACLT1W_06690 [Alistipes onderdonkii]
MTARGVDPSAMGVAGRVTDDEQTPGRCLRPAAVARAYRSEEPACPDGRRVGARRARLLLAAAEFGRRVAARGCGSGCHSTSDDVVGSSARSWKRLHEECWAVYLTSSNRIIERQRISRAGCRERSSTIGWLLNGRWNCSPHSWC